MPKQFIIHWPNPAVDQASWAYASETGDLDGAVETGTLAEAATVVEGRRSVLVVSGDSVLLSEAHVPGGSASRAVAAARYALEDQLADDVESLHFALGPKRDGDKYPVAIIDRDAMDQLTEACTDAGLRPMEIVPETLALPLRRSRSAEDSKPWTALIDDDQAIVRLNGYKGFVTDTDMAGVMLEGARADLDEDAQASITVYETENARAIDMPEEIDVERMPCEERLGLFASGLAAAPVINLLQGEYSPRTQLDKSLKPWRWTAVLAAVLLMIVVGGRWFELRQLTAQEEAIDAAIAESFQQALPNARMQRPKRQIEDALRNLGQGGAEGFTANMAAIVDSLATQPQTRLNSLTLRGDRFDLDLFTDAVPSLDALASDLSGRSSLRLEVQSANREDDGVRARVRVQ